jgi:hypothetical protein
MDRGRIGSSERESDFVPHTADCPDANLDRSWPQTMYTGEGHQMRERLWDETLDELEFAGVKKSSSKIYGSTRF